MVSICHSSIAHQTCRLAVSPHIPLPCVIHPPFRECWAPTVCPGSVHGRSPRYTEWLNQAQFTTHLSLLLLTRYLSSVSVFLELNSSVVLPCPDGFLHDVTSRKYRQEKGSLRQRVETLRLSPWIDSARVEVCFSADLTTIQIKMSLELQWVFL